MRRGLTLIELLIALSLMASLTVALSTWLAMTSRAYADHAAPTRWVAAAEAALGLVHQDLANGDFEPKHERTRVEVDQDLLRIRSRDQMIYSYRLRSDMLFRVEPTGERVLLDGVAAWECALDEEGRVLSVRIASADGQERTGVFQLP